MQRTWLHPDRPAKAPLAQPRKALGRIHGLAVRFGALPAAGATLLVGEGIETVLSLLAAAPALPGAAATLEARALTQGIAATVLTPEHGDFNDDLAALGPQALAARLAPLFGPGAWAAPATPRAHTGARQVP